jgi:hypothetical protein
MSDETFDRDLAAMLESRAARIGPSRLDLRTITDERQLGARTLSGRPRLAAAVSAVAASVALVVGAVLLGPFRGSPTASSSPSSSASASVVGASVRAYTAEELGDLVVNRSVELAGRLAIVRGVFDLSRLECGPGLCAGARLVGLPDGIVARIVQSASSMIGPEHDPAREGAFVVRFIADREDGHPLVDVIGQLGVTESDGWRSTVSALQTASWAHGWDYAALDAWLVRTAPMPCPSVVPPTPAPTDAASYECPTMEWLTDRSFEPSGPRLSLRIPGEALRAQAGAYDRFAPDPMTIDGGGVEPRHAIYLVRPDSGPECPVGERCWDRSLVEGRVDPIDVVGLGQSSAAPPSTLQPSADPSSAPIVRTVQDLARFGAPTEAIVDGWLVATPSLRCREAPLPSAPSFGCSEVDLLTAEPFQPWSNGSVRYPEIFVRVQAGAYRTLGGAIRLGRDGGFEPIFGRFRVRSDSATVSICDALGPCSAPPPVFRWVIVDRLDEPTRPGVVRMDPESCQPVAGVACL